jgi:hypothetical protein
MGLTVGESREWRESAARVPESSKNCQPHKLREHVYPVLGRNLERTQTAGAVHSAMTARLVDVKMSMGGTS